MKCKECGFIIEKIDNSADIKIVAAKLEVLRLEYCKELDKLEKTIKNEKKRDKAITKLYEETKKVPENQLEDERSALVESNVQQRYITKFGLCKNCLKKGVYYHCWGMCSCKYQYAKIISETKKTAIIQILDTELTDIEDRTSAGCACGGIAATIIPLPDKPIGEPIKCIKDKDTLREEYPKQNDWNPWDGNPDWLVVSSCGESGFGSEVKDIADKYNVKLANLKYEPIIPFSTDFVGGPKSMFMNSKTDSKSNQFKCYVCKKVYESWRNQVEVKSKKHGYETECTACMDKRINDFNKKYEKLKGD